eukprot:scaffold46413_cov237-Amphora_coffeaeformis.AAC.1
MVRGDISQQIIAAEYADDDDTLVIVPTHQKFDASGLMFSLGLVSFCFSGHAIVPAIYTSMKHPQDFESMGTLKRSSCLVLIFSHSYTHSFVRIKPRYTQQHPNNSDRDVLYSDGHMCCRSSERVLHVWQYRDGSNHPESRGICISWWVVDELPDHVIGTHVIFQNYPYHFPRGDGFGRFDRAVSTDHTANHNNNKNALLDESSSLLYLALRQQCGRNGGGIHQICLDRGNSPGIGLCTELFVPGGPRGHGLYHDGQRHLPLGRLSKIVWSPAAGNGRNRFFIAIVGTINQTTGFFDDDDEYSSNETTD